MAKLFDNTAQHGAAPGSCSLLEYLVRDIPDPVNYRLGLKRPDIELPHNIVLFARCEGIDVYPPPRHPAQYVLAMNLHGKGDVILDSRRIYLFPNYALLIFPGQLHYYENLDSRRMTWFYIGFQNGRPDPFALLRNQPVPMSGQAWQYSEWLVRDYVAQAPVIRPAGRIAATLWLLLMELVKTHRLREPAIPPPKDPILLKVDNLRRYIEEHAPASLHLPELARHMNMSLSALKDFSRKNMKMGLASYVRKQRIYLANGLMATTCLTMTEIAAQCGFSGIYTFSRTFKRVMKMPPSAYRKRLTALSDGNRGETTI